MLVELKLCWCHGLREPRTQRIIFVRSQFIATAGRILFFSASRSESVFRKWPGFTTTCTIMHWKSVVWMRHGVNEAWCEWGIRQRVIEWFTTMQCNACFKWLIPVFVCPILVEIPGSLVSYPVTIVDESCDWVVAVFVGSAKIQEHRVISKFIKSPFRVKCSQLIFNK